MGMNYGSLFIMLNNSKVKALNAHKPMMNEMKFKLGDSVQLVKLDVAKDTLGASDLSHYFLKTGKVVGVDPSSNRYLVLFEKELFIGHGEYANVIIWVPGKLLKYVFKGFANE